MKVWMYVDSEAQYRPEPVISIDDFDFFSARITEFMTKRELMSISGLKEGSLFYWRNSLFIVDSVAPFTASVCKKKVKKVVR